MEILYLLIPLSVLLVIVIGGIFWWSVRSGQFDDLEGPGYRVLMDDDRPRGNEEAVEGEPGGHDSQDHADAGGRVDGAQ